MYLVHSFHAQSSESLCPGARLPLEDRSKNTGGNWIVEESMYDTRDAAGIGNAIGRTI